MAGDIFFSALGLWAILALATARAASQAGYSFVEFLVYALVALPVAFVVVVFATGANTGQRNTASPGAGFETHSRISGLYALRMAAVVSVAAVPAFIALSPERTLTAVEQTVVTMEQAAYRGVKFDTCVSEGAFAECQPFDDIAAAAAADLNTVLERGGRLAFGDMKPDISGFFDSTPGSAETFGQRPVFTENRPALEKAASVAYRDAKRGTEQNALIPVTGATDGAPVQLIRD